MHHSRPLTSAWNFPGKYCKHHNALQKLKVSSLNKYTWEIQLSVGNGRVDGWGGGGGAGCSIYGLCRLNYVPL